MAKKNETTPSAAVEPQIEEQPQGWDVPWLASCAAIVALATFMRFFALAMRPLHHDEGVNGHFLTNLFSDGVYKYDTANYHGPTLY
jgi:predicted membrane-bound mannosyltransferase